MQLTSPLVHTLLFSLLTCFADDIVASRPRARTATMAVAVAVTVTVAVAKVEVLVVAGGGEVVFLAGRVRRPGKVGALRARGPRGPRREVGRREMGAMGRIWCGTQTSSKLFSPIPNGLLTID